MLAGALAAGLQSRLLTRNAFGMANLRTKEVRRILDSAYAAMREGKSHRQVSDQNIKA